MAQGKVAQRRAPHRWISARPQPRTCPHVRAGPGRGCARGGSIVARPDRAPPCPARLTAGTCRRSMPRQSRCISFRSSSVRLRNCSRSSTISASIVCTLPFSVYAWAGGIGGTPESECEPALTRPQPAEVEFRLQDLQLRRNERARHEAGRGRRSEAHVEHLDELRILRLRRGRHAPRNPGARAFRSAYRNFDDFEFSGSAPATRANRILRKRRNSPNVP